MKSYRPIAVLAFIFSISALFTQHAGNRNDLFRYIGLGLYTLLFVLFLLDLIIGIAGTTHQFHYLRKNSISVILTLLFTVLLILRTVSGSSAGDYAGGILPFIAMLRSIAILIDLSGDKRQFKYFVQGLFAHPSRTILLSFFLVILVGGVLLQLPVATADRNGLSIIDALFTSTSAVCVTGLIVVDTATVFSLFGQIVILVLIQIGGLSIIILSSFVIFLLRKQVSLEGKFLVSYVLNENDVNSLSGNLKRIVIITFLFEIAGALLLFLRFSGLPGGAGAAAFNALFHAVSAFCNAGFSLFSTSLESFTGDPYVVIVISVLIISGGLSFAVFINLFDALRDRYLSRIRKRRQFEQKLTLNTKIVLVVSAALLISGMFLIYALEHNNTLRSYSTGTQYWAAFFQSVTLRTAGFNTIPFGKLSTATLLVMILYMFIGGASGSTAGGIKVNTFTLILLYLRSAIKKEAKITVLKNTISHEHVIRAVLIMLFGLGAVIFGTIVLSMTESAPLDKILFETVSAFGTVGLSAGITGDLTIVGKLVIIILMFMGRVGPLTILAAMGEKNRKVEYEYPQGDILIG